MKISVVMPVYNEAKTVRELIKRVEDVDLDKEIIIIDDCSTDGTSNILKGLDKNPGIRVLYHDKNMGKGAALRTGFKHITGDIVLPGFLFWSMSMCFLVIALFSYLLIKGKYSLFSIGGIASATIILLVLLRVYGVPPANIHLQKTLYQYSVYARDNLDSADPPSYDVIKY